MSDNTVEDQSDQRDVSALEEEGEVAADYIETLLDILDLDGDIDIDVRDGRAYVSVHSDDPTTGLGVLAEPKVASSLQELTRLAVQEQSGTYSRLVLDVQHSRQQRRQDLEDLVTDAATRLEAGEAFVALEPMSSYDRKIVHDAARGRGLRSDSDGDGRHRHVVLRLTAE